MSLLSLLGKRFPETDGSKKCQDSFTKLGSTLRRLPQETSTVDTDLLEKSWQPCDTPYSEYAKGWRQCRGTWPGKRGFTCGMWILFHMLAAHSDDKNASEHFDIL